MCTIASNFEVNFDIFAARSGILVAEPQRPIGYGLVGLLIAISAAADCNFIKAGLYIVDRYPGIVIKAENLSREVAEVYDTWVKLSQTLVDTTNFLDSYIEFFPAALEFSKTIANDALQEITDEDIDTEELRMKADTNTIKL